MGTVDKKNQKSTSFKTKGYGKNSGACVLLYCLHPTGKKYIVWTFVKMEMENSVSVPINSLQAYQKNAIIKVMVLRQGNQTSTRQGSTTIRKMIFMDEEGTLIHGIIFSNIIQLFEDQMRINKTYIIEDPIVQPINKKYPNVNKNIELLLHRGTILREAQQQLTYDNLNFDFKEFAYVNANPVTDNEHDVIGILKKVRQVNRFERKDKLGFGYRREVVLINTMLQTIT
ncbi:replication protein A 70 kDa DNA-binding subunit B-like [Primulina eburnea]|uniref:replication protein A 70 kDa DNA-binding subunit B-like n=1 Tax=Primulina eburnea TaxID=1245227 RepID=UPI003C6BE533